MLRLLIISLLCFAECQQRPPMGGGDKGPGPDPGPNDKEPGRLSGHIAAGVLYNTTLNGVEKAWTISLKPDQPGRIQLGFVGMFVSATSSCNAALGPYLKIESKRRAERSHYMMSSTPIKSNQEYIVCGSITELQERVWIMDSSEVKITLRHLGHTDVNLYLQYAEVLSLKQSGDCTHDNNSGVFKLPMPETPSGNGEFCSALFQVDTSDALNITLDLVDLDNTVDCEYSRLLIYDGEDASKPLLGTFCGIHHAFTIFSITNRVFVLYESDGAGKPSQFEISYTGIAADDVPSTIQGIVTLPRQSNGVVTCDTKDVSCKPSFTLKSYNIFVWQISVPIGHGMFLEWNVFIKDPLAKNDEIEMKLYDTVFNWNYEEMTMFKITKSTLGSRMLKSHLISVFVSAPQSVDLELNLSYHSNVDATRTFSECRKPASRLNIVSGASTEIVFNVWNTANCIWIFKASNPDNFVKLQIESIVTPTDNDCVEFGYAVYDSDTPNDIHKLIGPYCNGSDPDVIISTQQYMTVVFYTNGQFVNAMEIKAFVSETHCVAAYSDSQTSIDVSRRSCVVLFHFPSRNETNSYSVTFPVKNLTEFRIEKTKSRGFQCTNRVGCLHYFKQTFPFLPTCTVDELRTIPEILSICPGLIQFNRIVMTNRRVKDKIGNQCKEHECATKPMTSSDACGRFVYLDNQQPKTGPDKCHLTLSRTDHNCKLNGTQQFYRYRIRLTGNIGSNNFPNILERNYDDPCTDIYTETTYTADRQFGDMYVAYTVNSDFVSIELNKIYWFTLEFELVEIQKPHVTLTPDLCPGGNYFHHNGSCYSLGTTSSKSALTWNSVDDQCENEGSQLTSIGDMEELEFLKQMISTYWRYNVSQMPHLLFFIGLKGKSDNERSWTDGTQLRFTDWHTRLYSDKLRDEDLSFNPPTQIATVIPTNRLQPILSDYSLCTVMYILGHSVMPSSKTNWAKLPCNYPLPAMFICKKSSLVKQTFSPVESSLAASRCPSSWTFLSGTAKCLKLVTTLKPLSHSVEYNEAQLMCEQSGGQIAQVDNGDIASVRYLLSLWKHQPQYRSIWLAKSNGSCRVIQPQANTWETLSLYINGERTSSVEYLITEWNCDDKAPFIWSVDELTPSNQLFINKSAWDTRKGTFPTGPLNVLCEQDVVLTSKRCGSRQYTCNDGTCIFESQVCDGVVDCLQGADDEKSCDCRGKFSCSSGDQCIPYSLYCDHVVNCKDGSDEENCTYPKCTTGEFRCNGGTCISRNKTCNFIADCPLGDDEVNALCNWTDSCDNGFHCYSENCIPLSRKDDLQSDCPTFTDEDELLKYADSLRGETLVTAASATTDNELVVNYHAFCERTNEVRCQPDHTKCFKREMACVYDLDNYSPAVVDGCRDFRHLQNCSLFDCPGMFKCTGSFCIPRKRVCDGNQDCLQGEDEVGCDKYSCPGLLRCPGQRVCIEQHLVCDGNNDCEKGADEKYCDLPRSCPALCSCDGFSMECKNASLTSIPEYSHDLRFLLFANNMLELTSDTLNGYFYLGHLDLSYNNITSIPSYAFRGLDNLLVLNLRGNDINQLDVYSFYGVNIIRLDLSFNNMVSIPTDVFQGRIVKLDITINDKNMKISENAFSQLQIEYLETDAFRFCCGLNDTVQCSPEPDEFSTCEDLLGDEFLRYAIWVIGTFAFVGNIAVFIWRLKTERQNVNSFLILNLSVSDFMMGLYLLIIAAADQYFESVGNFYQYDLEWRAGFLCQFEGFLSTVACEMSVFTLVVITIDRVVILIFTFQVTPLSRRSAAIVAAFGWLLCCAIATVPLVVYGSEYYGSTSVCLPFTLRNMNSKGWIYSTTVFLCFNMLCFITIATGYLGIYFYARKRRMKSKRKSTARDMKLARRLVLIVLSDFCCWVPICTIGVVALSGVTISRQVSAWVAVFIMPINSALNPLLYTFSSIDIKKVCCPKLYRNDSSSDEAPLKPIKNRNIKDLSQNTTMTPVSSPAIPRRIRVQQPVTISNKSVKFTETEIKYDNKGFSPDEVETSESLQIHCEDDVSLMVMPYNNNKHEESQQESQSNEHNRDITVKQNGSISPERELPDCPDKGVSHSPARGFSVNGVVIDDSVTDFKTGDTVLHGVEKRTSDVVIK